MIQVHTPNKTEIEECVKVFLTAFNRPLNPRSIKSTLQIWQALVENDVTQFVSVKSKNQIVGTGSITIHENVAYIGHMSVLPKYQKLGIGSELFQELLRICKRSNRSTVELYATATGEKLYKKFGFQSRFDADIYEIKDLNNFFEKKSCDSITTIPEWIMKLDEYAYGYSRVKLLEFLLQFGAKFITIENRGYAILLNNKIGPVIASNLNVAVRLINHGYSLGYNILVIPHHELSNEKLYENFKLQEIPVRHGVKMNDGLLINGYNEFIYAIYSYATG